MTHSGSNQLIRRIVITGPESTGKTTLANRLSGHYRTVFVPEYAREYILSLDRHYDFADIEKIAAWQYENGIELTQKANKYLFFDTYLIITKIWFLFFARTCPEWIDEELRKKSIDLFLLCDYDLPWELDPVRENGGEMRRILFNLYRNEIEHYGYPYRIITGKHIERFINACRAIDGFFGSE